MIRHLLALRLATDPSLRDQIRQTAELGAKGVILEAVGDLAPQRLGQTGRRELRNLLRALELALVGVALPTRRPFDTAEQLDDRLRRADSTFAMAHELGTGLVLARLGPVPPEEEVDRREIFMTAVQYLGQRADHRGVRLALETGPEPCQPLTALLEGLDNPCLAASLDPRALLQGGIDPAASAELLGSWVAHAYAGGFGGSGVSAANPRGFGFAPGVLDWESYLGALEEIGYRGFLTVWPERSDQASLEFAAVTERLRRLS
jgi:sugar phosphate isomerase/epimerase